MAAWTSMQTHFKYRPTVTPHTAVGDSKISLNSRDTAEFIRLYQQEELLWNVNLPDHTNRPKRIESLQRISKLMGKNWSIDQVKDKIMSLRSRYSKEIVKVRVSIAAGTEPYYQPVWQYFPMLDCFLRPFSVTRKTDTPVVRAFHKRLVEGGVSGNQTLASSPTPTQIQQPLPDAPLAPAPHFLLHHPPPPASVMAASHYQQNQQRVAAPQQLTYDCTDDDDVQIIEDMGKGMEEVTMLIEDEGNDDSDSGYNGGSQEGSFQCDDLMAMETDRRCVKNAGSWTNGSDTEGEGGNASVEEGGLLHYNEDDSVDHIDYPHGNVPGESVPDKQAGGEQGQRWLYDTGTDQSETVSGGQHQNTDDQTQSKKVTDSEETVVVVIKKERPTSPKSPPLPPLPPRLSSSDAHMEDGSVLGGSEDSDGSSQARGLDTDVRPSSQRMKRRPRSTEDSHKHGVEFLHKRIKQENDWPMCAVSSPSTEVGGLCSGQVKKVTGQLGSSQSGGGWDPANSRKSASHDDITVPPAPSASWGNTSTSAPNLNACAAPPLIEPQPCRTREAPSSVWRDCHDVTIADRVTDAVSGQMTSLLHTLVTNLVDRSSGADGDTAFVRYVAAELKQLDEDLQADVKFSIQKAIYDAQKEMSRRRTRDDNGAA
ncbi:uncharacterized protein LOC143283787 [Babylonia areolata]|uniref:uncharacterized protein LOC143283787 n=1 Tax=Babylonia areolata TaxID=304850 RepID=UPI003FD08040